MNRNFPHYEFRIFAPDLDLFEKKIVAGYTAVSSFATVEFYILSPGNDVNNVKIRRGEMDIKSLLAVESGLEQWARSLKVFFPLDRDTVLSDVYPALNVPAPSLLRSHYGIEQFLAEIVEPDSALSAIEIGKERSLFARGPVSAEFARLVVEGVPYHTMALESEEKAFLLEAIESFGLSGRENTNYIRFLKGQSG